MSRRTLLAVNFLGHSGGIAKSIKKGEGSFLNLHQRQGFASSDTISKAPSGMSATTTPSSALLKSKLKEKFLSDYKKPDWEIDSAELEFVLDPTSTSVRCKMVVKRSAHASAMDFVLDGEDLVLEELLIDGKPQTKGSGYTIDDDESLRIKASILPANVQSAFQVITKVKINPENNKQLMGLYYMRDLFSTQCEAEGFRKITYFLDRPDVMTKFRVRVEGPKDSCPILLSNGNVVEEGDGTSPNTHYKVFEDPHKKPCYLFALVAGNLGKKEGSFKTKDNRDVTINIWSEHKNVDKLDWAMESIKTAMKWDEENYGRVYDLDVFHIVGVPYFNMGAMENKGLNIFNASALLTHPSMTTDAGFQRVMDIIGHEYFHNWTGDRVTCRDWFQLTLKEGLTVFRDQTFTADIFGVPAKRIDEVMYIMGTQFNEAAGPLSHPVRPKSYIAMDNFYTVTVYDKGAEIIRMYRTMLGTNGFRKGMDKYFELHDGQAVTCDDFLNAMSVANNKDFTQFSQWYNQASTPKVVVKSRKYDAGSKKYTITFAQSSKEKTLLHIPISVGLIGKTSKKDVVPGRVLEMTKSEETFVFDNVNEDCAPSVLRNFSAPVILEYSDTAKLSPDEKELLIVHDSDVVNRFLIADEQKLEGILVMTREYQKTKKMPEVPKYLMHLYSEILNADIEDAALKAELLRLPTWDRFALFMRPYAPQDIHTAIRELYRQLYAKHSDACKEIYSKMYDPKEDQRIGAAYANKRALATAVSSIICGNMDAEAASYAYKMTTSENMTIKTTGLAMLSNMESELREKAFSEFYDSAKGNDQLLDMWFAIQARTTRKDSIAIIKALVEHPDFSMDNPNRLRSVWGPASSCHPRFHSSEGETYKSFADMIINVDAFNRQIAARFVPRLASYKDLAVENQAMIKRELERIKAVPTLSSDTYEMVTKCLVP